MRSILWSALFFIVILAAASMSCISGYGPVLGSAEIDDEPFRFGVNYLSTHIHYEPYYLQDEELDRDFGLFSRQGFEYVTFAVVWKYLEPQLGAYNEAALDDLVRMCNFASKYNLRVIIDFYTMMSNNSWTMPEWLSPRKFEAVFINATARQAWLDYLNHCAARLNSSESIWSWHMMNEPARREWACNVTIEEYLNLWTEMRAVFKAYSDRPVSVRFAAQVFEDPNHFNLDTRIYSVIDYLALNWYEDHCPRENLTRIVRDAQQYTSVMLSEFGSNAPDDEVQSEKYKGFIGLFRSLGLRDCIAWMWRADYVSPNPEPPGTGYNLAKDVNGTARQAFYAMDALPPEITIQSPERNKAYASGAVALTFALNEAVSWMGYSLDEQATITAQGNTTITGLSEGAHSLRFYANDTAGNVGSSTVYFSVKSPYQRLFSDGFESGSFSQWSGTSRTSGEIAGIVASPVSAGKYGARFVSNGGGGTEKTYAYRSIASSSEILACSSLRVSRSGIAQDNDRIQFIMLMAGGTNVASAGWRRNGGVVHWTLQIRSGTSTITAYSTMKPALNIWYSVELHWRRGTTGGLAELYVNGTLVCSLTNRNTAVYGNVSTVRFGLPEVYSCASTTAYFDSCIVSKATT